MQLVLFCLLSRTALFSGKRSQLGAGRTPGALRACAGTGAAGRCRRAPAGRCAAETRSQSPAREPCTAPNMSKHPQTLIPLTTWEALIPQFQTEKAQTEKAWAFSVWGLGVRFPGCASGVVTNSVSAAAPGEPAQISTTAIFVIGSTARHQPCPCSKRPASKLCGRASRCQRLTMCQLALCWSFGQEVCVSSLAALGSLSSQQIASQQRCQQASLTSQHGALRLCTWR